MQEFALPFFVWSVISALGMGTACLVIGLQNMDTPCLEKDEVGLDMAQYLIGKGVSNMMPLVLLLLGFLVVVCIAKKCPNCADLLEAFIVPLFVMVILFRFVYFLIGLVVLFRSTLDCIGHGESVGIMGIFGVFFFWA